MLRLPVSLRALFLQASRVTKRIRHGDTHPLTRARTHAHTHTHTHRHRHTHTHTHTHRTFGWSLPTQKKHIGLSQKLFRSKFPQSKRESFNHSGFCDAPSARLSVRRAMSVSRKTVIRVSPIRGGTGAALQGCR